MQDQNKTLASSNFVKNFTNATTPDYKPTDIAKNLEQSLGKTGGQILDITAPVAGVGSTGAKTLAKLGVKLGAVQGASNAMERGNSAEDVVGNALAGGAVGGATGFVGGGVGSLLGKVTGSSAKLGSAAEKFGVKEGLNKRAQQATDFANVGKSDLKNAMSYTKGGEPLGLNGISDHLRSLGMEPNAQNMKLYADTVLGKVGGHMQDMLGDVKVPVGSPADVGREFIVSNAGTLGGLKSRTGAATDTMQQIRTLTEGLGSTPTAPDVLGTISKLESAASSLSKAAQNGDRVAVGQQGAYKAVANHLRDALSKHQDVNGIINDFRMPAAGSQLLRDEVTNQGGSDQLSGHILDTLNNAKTYQDLKSAMQPAMVAKDLASSAEEAAQNTIPKSLPGAGGGMGDLSTVYEAGSLMRGNPAAAVPLLGKMAGGVDKLTGKLASKINPEAYQQAYDRTLKGAGHDLPQLSEAPPPVQRPTGPVGPQPTPPQPSVPATPTNITFEGSSPDVPIPVSFLKEVPVASPPTDLRTVLPRLAARDFGVPIDLRKPAQQLQRTKTIRSTNGGTPSNVIRQLTGKVQPGRPEVVGQSGRESLPVRISSPASTSPRAEIPTASRNSAKGGPINLPAILSALAGARPSISSTAAVSSADTATTPQIQVPQTPDTNLVDSELQPSSDSLTPEPQTSPYSQENMMSDIQRDPKHMSDYLSLYKALNPTNNTANAAQQKNVLASKNASSTLRQIESSFNQAGGGQGLLGGNVSNFLGELGMNSGAKTYNDTATALAASLYKALGNTGTITDRDQAMIAKLIPKTTDTAETAQNKVSQLENLLNQAQQNALTPATPSYGDNAALLQGLGIQ